MTHAINCAMQQNYIPLIKCIRVTNITELQLRDIRIELNFEPAFAKSYLNRIPILLTGQTIELSPVPIVLSTEFLMSMTEKMVGSIGIDVMSEEKLLLHLDKTIELLTYDEWTGYTMMPELLSAYVIPNHTRITDISMQAGISLNQWGYSPSFTGYQSSNPSVVKYQMAAIYAALQSESIAYAEPPAGFEQIGQRIRLADAVLSQKRGSCLDLSLLYAGCLEAVGLHPLIVIMKGHAFAGCFLEDKTFPECVQDDVTGIKKRAVAGIDEICLVECTAFTVGKNITFDEAVRLGVRHLENSSEFVLLLDVKRSRSDGIRPIPMIREDNNTLRSVDYGTSNIDTVNAPDEIEHVYLNQAIPCETMTKQKVWERKLLDLSLRNMLLNFRVTKHALQLLTVDLGSLEDVISSGTDLVVLPRTHEWKNMNGNSTMIKVDRQDTVLSEYAQTEFKNKRIRSFEEGPILADKLKNLCRQAKVSLEENGSNTLYLAMGFLKWYETDISEKERYAPLVLIPVDIVHRLSEKSYSIRLREEEVQMNITLLELLRQDYGIEISGLDPLPGDETGTDLKLVFNTIRQAVMAQKRWDVEEFAFVGLFSFSQFIMWNDIRNRSEALQQNKVVASLISGKMEWTESDAFIEHADGIIDEKMLPTEYAIPVSADSTQMSAIRLAAMGQSFVLHGPPGTGKSQTITNMIANALYQGKTVLFVAEKMAALSVVEQRLTNIGLDPFCLELHSNKAKKRDVLEQLQKTLEVGHVKEPKLYEETATLLQGYRTSLNEIVTELHRKRQYGFSLYEAITKYEHLKTEQFGKLIMTREQVSGMNEKTYSVWMEVLQRLRAATAACGGIYENPLIEMANREYSVTVKNELLLSINQFSEALEARKKSCVTICNIFGLDASGTYEELDRLYIVCSLLNTLIFMPEELFQYQELGLLREKFLFCIASGREKNRLEQRILAAFEPEVLNYDYRNAELLWKQAETEWFLPKSLHMSKLCKELQFYAKTPKQVTKDTIKEYYTLFASYSAQAKNAACLNADAPGLTEFESRISSLFGLYWGEQPQWDKIEEIYFACLKLQQAALNSAVLQTTIVSACKDLKVFRSFCGNEMSDYIRNTNICSELEEQLEEGHKVVLDPIYLKTSWFTDMEFKIKSWINNIENLKAWSVCLGLQDEASENGLDLIVKALQQGSISSNDMLPAFECACLYACANDTIETVPKLHTFHGAQFDEMIEQFIKTDVSYRELAIHETIARLSAKIPGINTAAANSSEIGILQKAIRSNGRMLSIRKLFDSIPELLRRLCPCMLMSPISVAQYIDPDYPKFDLVIFDEASQLPTCEAVGAIARGNHVVVVGDPKQLPPTSFFHANRLEEDNFELEDLDSVLDDCLALNMPQEHLLWHYRSRHESLIAYSNMQYYGNKLYTFPSPNDLVSEVRFIPIDGFYDRSNSKQNRAEAEAIITEITRRLKDPELQKESIGVVTFSLVQQSLIEDLLEEAFQKEPELDLINQNAYEPIFIKNLENVQGDERDVILFSIGYGPDKDGKVTLNFGPLNREGGWRRLNVAISRARKHMLIFSTLRPEQIDLSRTLSDGVAGLRGFLEYAAKGKQVLTTPYCTVLDASGSVEERIAKSIESLGFHTKCNIGCSEYKVDIGVIDPDDSDRFILGILCDGKNYQKAGTARDRNLLQPDILKSLGWNLHRVWILDWIDAPDLELKKIKTIVEDLKNIQHSTIQQISKSISHEMFEKETLDFAHAGAIPYVVFITKDNCKAEEINLPASRKRLEHQLSEIIEKEGPISYNILLKRILSIWNVSRSSSKIEQTLCELLESGLYQKTGKDDSIFYWDKIRNPKAYRSYRIPTTQEEDRRNLEDIAPQEIANAVCDILAEQIGMTQEDLIRETAKLFGFSRIGSIMEQVILCGIQEAKIRGDIVIGEKITLRED